jgi:hypothetical protein
MAYTSLLFMYVGKVLFSSVCFQLHIVKTELFRGGVFENYPVFCILLGQSCLRVHFSIAVELIIYRLQMYIISSTRREGEWCHCPTHRYTTDLLGVTSEHLEHYLPSWIEIFASRHNLCRGHLLRLIRYLLDQFDNIVTVHKNVYIFCGKK